MRVAVVTDSGSGITKSQAENTGIFVLPLQLTIDGKSYLEGETIQADEVYEFVKQNCVVKTSMPPLGRIETLFEQLKQDGYDRVFAVPICSGLSGTISAMVAAAARLELPFDFIDCFSTFSNQLYLVQQAKLLLDDNKTVEEVKQILQSAADDSITIIVPNDLKHLSRGGRLTPMAATLGGLLKIKPILRVSKETSGKIDSFEKVRTMQKALRLIIHMFHEHEIDESYLLTVGHVADDEMGKEFLAMVKENFPKCEVLYQQLASVIGAHTGIGCVGIQYIKRVQL